MKNLSSILVVLLFAFCTQSVKSQNCSMHKVEIVCGKVINAPDFDDFLQCHVDESMKATILGSSVSSVVHKKNASDVTISGFIKGLIIVNATVHFIPNGIGSKFPNLEALVIERSDLLSVNKENFRQFGTSFETLSLAKNNLTSIDADLFEFIPNLSLVMLSGNPLRFIAPELFQNLKIIKTFGYFDLSEAGCINAFFNVNDGHDVATFKRNNEKCNDESARIETQNLIKKATCAEASIPFIRFG